MKRLFALTLLVGAVALGYDPRVPKNPVPIITLPYPVCAAGDFMTCDGGACSCATPAGGGSLFDAGAAYITYAADPTLSNERVLTSGTNTTVDLTVAGQAKVNLSGTVPQTLGGTGAGALTCSAGQHITSNGTAYSCSADTGSGTPTADGGTPAGAGDKYILQQATGALPNAQSLGALTTGLALNTVTGSTGVLSAYGGTSCTNQFPRSLNASGAATCASVASADLNITASTCTNQFISAISSSGAGTCTTDTLASAQHANQGTTTTVLHGNAAGNPSWGSVVTGDISGQVAIAQGGTNATATPTAGGVAYGSGTAYAFTAAGTSGQHLKSAGSGTPVWESPLHVVQATADQTFSSTTAAASTYLTWTAVSAVNYSFTCFINATNTATSAIRMAVNAPASSTVTWNFTRPTTSLTAMVSEQITARWASTCTGCSASVTASVNASTQLAIASGLITAGGNGTITIYFADSTNAQNNVVKKGSYCQWYSVGGS